jgi:replicative DNA helicase
MATTQKLNDEYSEKCLLAILLTNNELVDMVVGTVDKEYFYNLTHRHIYERICSLRKNEKPINFVTISESENSINEQTKLSTYCAELSSLVSGSAEWETYVNSLADCYAERLSRSMANSFLDDNSASTINERVDKLINDLSKISVRKNNGYSMKQLAYDNAKHVDEVSK